jgi:hypothetical protein
MDEDRYRTQFRQVNTLPCAFTKAILAGHSRCGKARRLLLAEREAVACTVPSAQALCAEVLASLRDKARFALRLPEVDGPLPHGKELKVECGGLAGLAQAYGEHREGPGVADIHALVRRAVAEAGGVDGLPYPEMVKAIAHTSARRPTRST